MTNLKKSSISGTLSHSAFPNGRESAEVTLTRNELQIHSDSARLTWLIKDITIKWGGANNALLFITYRGSNEYTFFTRDVSILKLLKNSPELSVAKQVHHLTRKHSLRLVGIPILLTLLIAIIPALYFLKDPLTTGIANIIPKSWERKLGEAAYVGVRSDTKILEDAALTSEFSELIKPILQAAESSGYSFDVHISKDTDLNAFALPGGILVVNAGAILKAERLDLILGVLAHEISHVTKRHTTRNVITVFGLYLAVDFFLGNFFGTAAAITQGTSYLLQQGFSRDMEHEADASGLQYLAIAKINPQGMVDFFKLVLEEQKDSPLAPLEGYLSFMSTHPDTEGRIQYLSNQISQTSKPPYKELPEAQFQAFKSKLRTAL